ncbi:hypothetical protein KY311_02395 [Candidatus Woesearchaeota archaeon]|nr:hypothetical protein [Candidatus Woesearchaeota archaeon]
MKKNIKLALAIASFVLLALPSIFRIGKPLPGIESYYFINMFSFMPELLMRMLPLAFGILSLVLFYLFQKQLGIPEEIRAYSTALMAVSVPFLYVSNFFTAHFILLFLILLGFYLYSKQGSIWLILSVPIFMLTILFDVYSFVTVIFLLAYSLTLKKRLVPSLLMSFLIAITALAILPEHLFVVQSYFIQHIIFAFGSPIGFGVSAIILALFGFVISWKAKYRLLYVYLAGLSLFVLSYFFYFVPIYLNLFIVVFTASALSKIFSLTWELKQLKTVAGIAIVCTILFSAFSFAFYVKAAMPDDNVVDSLLALKKKPDATVFSHPTRGFWIEYYSGKPAYADILTLNESLEATSEFLYYSRHFYNSTKILNDSNIRYIWADGEMKQGLVWTKPQQGLLFLFVDEHLFQRIYNKGDVEVWEYLPGK